MPPKARVTSKSSPTSYTSTTTRSEPTISNSVDSDNESIIEPAQEQSSSNLNDADYGLQQTGTATGFGPSNANLDNTEIELNTQNSDQFDRSESDEANNELAKFGKIDPTKFITKLEDANSFHSFE